jgi:flavin-binding protein dodecin
MAVLKVIEIMAESPESWEKATQNAVDEVCKTVRNVESVYIQHFQAVVNEGKITKYRINAKISFTVD